MRRRRIVIVAVALAAVLASGAGVLLVRARAERLARDQGVVVADVHAECQSLEASSDDLWVSAKGRTLESQIPPGWRGRRVEARLVLTGDLDETWIEGHLTAADGSRALVLASRRGDRRAIVHDDCPFWPADR